jgi:hypothetical protein
VAKVRVKLDRSGMAAMLRSAEVEGATKGVADRIAERARQAGTVQRHSTPVVIHRYTATGGRLVSSRPAFAVSLAHASGLGQEAKYGVLNRAASEEA